MNSAMRRVSSMAPRAAAAADVERALGEAEVLLHVDRAAGGTRRSSPAAGRRPCSPPPACAASKRASHVGPVATTSRRWPDRRTAGRGRLARGRLTTTSAPAAAARRVCSVGAARSRPTGILVRIHEALDAGVEAEASSRWTCAGGSPRAGAARRRQLPAAEDRHEQVAVVGPLRDRLAARADRRVDHRGRRAARRDPRRRSCRRCTRRRPAKRRTCRMPGCEILAACSESLIVGCQALARRRGRRSACRPRPAPAGRRR